MPLTPADVQNVTFSKPPLGKRGYHEDEVDAFLDLVQAELARLIQENNHLQQRVEQLSRQLREKEHSPGPPTPVALSPDQRDVQAAKVLGMAQQVADRLTGDAKAQADAMLHRARTTSERALAEAKMQAEELVNEAKARAATMLNEAQTRAENLERQAREKAATLEHDAMRKHSEIIGSISYEKSVLEKELNELRAREREYRTQLKAYLEAQLRKLDEAGIVPASSIPHQRTSAPAGAGLPDGAAGGPPRHLLHDGGSTHEEITQPAPHRGFGWKPAVELSHAGTREE
jgi:DivIVA domain-containing protein